MGYRSDGGIVLYAPKAEMLAALTRLRITRTHSIPWTQRPEITIFEDEAGDTLVWRLEYSGWKWYTQYPEIQEFERIWHEAGPDIRGYRWRFGEDDDDYEHSVRVGDESTDYSLVRSVDYTHNEPLPASAAKYTDFLFRPAEV